MLASKKVNIWWRFAYSKSVRLIGLLTDGKWIFYFVFLNEFSFFKIDFRLREYGPLTLDFLSTNFKCVLSMFLSLKIHQLITLKRILALRRTGTISNSLKMNHCWIRTTFFCKRIIERRRPPEWLPLNFND